MQATKAYEGLEVQSHSFVTSALNGANDQLYASPALSARRVPQQPFKRRLANRTTSLAFLGIETRILHLPARRLVTVPTAWSINDIYVLKIRCEKFGLCSIYLGSSSSTAFNYLHIGATYLTQDKCVLCSDGFPAQVFNYINYKRNCELKYSPIVSLWSGRTYAWLRLSIVPSRFLVALTSFKRFTFEKTPRCVSHPNNHPPCTLALSGLASLTALL